MAINKLIAMAMQTLEVHGFHETIAATLVEQDLKKGLRLTQTNPGEILEVRTANNTYFLGIIDPTTGDVAIKGGEFFRNPTRATLVGSTWGANMIKLGYLGKDMHMEIARYDVIKDGMPTTQLSITTSQVQDIKIITKTGRPIDLEQRSLAYQRLIA